MDYLRVPIVEVKVRILKKLMIGLELRQELVSVKEGEVRWKFLGRFLHRKQVLKLICKDILQTSIISDYNNIEITPLTTTVIQYIGSLLSHSDITSKRLHSSLLPFYQNIFLSCTQHKGTLRELSYIIDTVTDCCRQRSAKLLTTLRQLFSKEQSQRKLSTHILKKTWAILDFEDILSESFELKDAQSEVFIDLKVNLEGLTGLKDFNYDKLYLIFKDNQDAELKKTALEQMARLICNRDDTLGISGRKLYREDLKDHDVFSIAVKELLEFEEQVNKKGINSMHPKELTYLQELLRFVSLSFIFYFDEPAVNCLLQDFMDQEDSEEFEESMIMRLLNSMTLFLSSKHLEIRKNSLRCLQAILLSDQVKTCIDMSSGMPYFSVPTYLKSSYEFLFPVKFYKHTITSKIQLLSSEEKGLISLLSNNKSPQDSTTLTITNWFDKLLGLNPSQTLTLLNTSEFQNLSSNNSSISKNIYSTPNPTLIKDNFEIIPSDMPTSLTLSKFYTQLKFFLQSLHLKISLDPSQTLDKGLQSFLLLLTCRMREVNLPYNYLYSQIVEQGIDNRRTYQTEGVKLNEYGYLLSEILYMMVESVLGLVMVEQLVKEKYGVDLNCTSGMFESEGGDKDGLIGLLSKLSIFLKEKGEPFRILVLKVSKVLLENKKLSQESLQKIGTFVIDTVAGKKLDQNFSENYSIILSLEILIEIVENYDFCLSSSLKSISVSKEISETGLERISSFNTFGWLTRFIKHRDSRIRLMVWTLLKSIPAEGLLTQHPTLIDDSINCFLEESEIYAVSIEAMSFISTICEYLLENQTFMDEENEEEERLPKLADIIQKINQSMFITKLDHLLYQDNLPPLFIGSLVRFMKCLKSDFSSCLPIFTSLDLWSVLSQYLKPQVVMNKYNNDQRQVLYKGKNKKLRTPESDPNWKIQAFAFDANSILQLVLESVKKDPNLASVITRSVPFLENMFKCLVYLLQNIDSLTLNKEGDKTEIYEIFVFA